MRISDWSSDVCSSDLRIITAHDLDIEPVREDLLKLVQIARCGGRLPVRQKLRHGPLAPGGERDQPVGAPCKRMERDVRSFMHRPVEMGRRHKPAERSEEHQSELPSPMRNPYAAFRL